MKAKTLCSLFVVVVAMLSMAPLGLSAKTLGMVADDATASATVFDADTHAVLGTVSIDPGDPFLSAIGDVLITPDLERDFVTNRSNQVFVIDLTTSPPSLAGGTNPIPISNLGNDLSISPNGKFLVVSDGTLLSSGTASVIDIAAQAEISTFSPNAHPISVDVCSDSSVLVTTIAKFDSAKVHRLTLSGTGTLTHTGEVLSVSGGADNVYCAPGARSGVAMYSAVTSFTIPGLSEVDTRSSSEGNAISGTFNPTGNRVFVRGGSIDVFDFNPTTGELGASPLLTFSVAFAHEFPGFDQIALHPNGGKLYVSEPSSGMSPSAVNVYDPNTGALLASIMDPAIVEPTGITVVAETDPCALPPPAGAIVGTDGPDQINGTSGNDKIFGLGGSDQINGRGGNDLICGGGGNDQVTGGAGDDVLDVKDGVSGNDSADGGPGNDACTGDPGDALSSCNP
jgi:Ca2+-binding RTX toxin-like protein